MPRTEEGLVVADVGVPAFARYAGSLHPSSYTRLAYANQPKAIQASVYCPLIIDTHSLMDCLGFLPQGPGFDCKSVHVVFVSVNTDRLFFEYFGFSLPLSFCLCPMLL